MTGVSYNLSFRSLLTVAISYGVSLFLSFSLASCGGGGGEGGDGDFVPLTDAEKAAAKIKAELSPYNLDVPYEVVPEIFQGKQLTEVRLEVKAPSVGGFGPQTISFVLCPGADVDSGSLQDGAGSVSFTTASWSGQSAGNGTKTVRFISIKGTSSDARELDLLLSDISITSKTVNGQQTTYTGRVSSCDCTLGGMPWLCFPSDSIDCTVTMLYVIDSSN